MVKGVQLIFDSTLHYSPGSVVEGSLVVIVDKPKDYERIIVTLRGGAEVSWRGTNEDVYRNSETYIDAKAIVWRANEPFDNRRKLPIGEHNFPFSFQLPIDAPSSFETVTGQIRYEVEARIERSGLINLIVKPNHMIKARLTVENRTPRTDILRRYRQPATMSGTKQLKFLFLKRGFISATVNVPRTGFSPGEVIPITVNIFNRSYRQIQVASVLNRRSTFTAFAQRCRKQRTVNKVITSSSEALIMPWTNTTVEDMDLTIPTRAATTMRADTCSCIRVEYVLEVLIRIPWSANLHLKNPIAIAYSAPVVETVEYSTSPVANPPPYSVVTHTT